LISMSDVGDRVLIILRFIRVSPGPPGSLL
jgi:hypothetical protein